MAWWDSPRGAGFSSKAAAGAQDHLESNREKERSRQTQLVILLLITQEPVANLTALGVCSSSRVEDEAMIQLLGRVLHWNISWLDIIASPLDQRGLADLADVLERGRCGLLHFASLLLEQVGALGRQEGGAAARVKGGLEEDVEGDQLLVEARQKSCSKT